MQKYATVDRQLTSYSFFPFVLVFFSLRQSQMCLYVSLPLGYFVLRSTAALHGQCECVCVYHQTDVRVKTH